MSKKKDFTEVPLMVELADGSQVKFAPWLSKVLHKIIEEIDEIKKRLDTLEEKRR